VREHFIDVLFEDAKRLRSDMLADQRGLSRPQLKFLLREKSDSRTRTGWVREKIASPKKRFSITRVAHEETYQTNRSEIE
jgi:hypothetical protein